MIYPHHLLHDVIEPTLLHVGLYSLSASRLVLGTALVESRATYLRQHPRGPALGIYQMEPATLRWLWWDWLPINRPGLRERINELVGAWGIDRAPEYQLPINLAYATAMCRVRYLAVPAALPGASDIDGHARYWKKYYNTAAGKGRVEDYVAAYKKNAPIISA